MVSKKQGIERLGQVPLFSGLSSKDLGRVWDAMKIVRHPEGKEIITEGHKGIGFHLILSGSVRVTRAAGGRAVVLGPDDSFGEMALIDDAPRSATVTATEPTETAVLSSSAFRTMAKRHPDMTWKLLVQVVGRLRDAQNVTAQMTS